MWEELDFLEFQIQILANSGISYIQRGLRSRRSVVWASSQSLQIGSRRKMASEPMSIMRIKIAVLVPGMQDQNKMVATTVR